jgi:hypothetical protein
MVKSICKWVNEKQRKGTPQGGDTGSPANFNPFRPVARGFFVRPAGKMFGG